MSLISVVFRIFMILSFSVFIWNSVTGHGRLEEPPSRSTMWRFGFNTEHNYDDHQLYCGGLQRMIKNGGKCGVCGDPWDVRPPRPNEDGGIYGKGIIVRTYGRGQVIDVVVDITANHKGYFEFKLCPVIGKNPITDECMDKHTLNLADGSGSRYHLPADSKNQKFPLKLVLPKHLTCKRCVFQWTYTAGNNWGKCRDGKGAIGCGYQETFRACADISIIDETNEVNVNSENEIDESNDVLSDLKLSSATKMLTMTLTLLTIALFLIFIFN